MRTGRLLAALAIVTGCATVVTTPAPTPAPGSRIRYATRPDPGRLLPARLVSLDADSLVSERFVAGPTFGEWVREATATDSLAVVQVRVGRHGNAGKGALIGGLAGLAIGVVCAATTESGWLEPTPGECVAGFTVTGLGTGALIGLIVRSDVWAPATLPATERKAAEPPVALRASPLRVGVAVPVGPVGR